MANATAAPVNLTPNLPAIPPEAPKAATLAVVIPDTAPGFTTGEAFRSQIAGLIPGIGDKAAALATADVAVAATEDMREKWLDTGRILIALSATTDASGNPRPKSAPDGYAEAGYKGMVDFLVKRGRIQPPTAEGDEPKGIRPFYDAMNRAAYHLDLLDAGYEGGILTLDPATESRLLNAPKKFVRLNLIPMIADEKHPATPEQVAKAIDKEKKRKGGGRPKGERTNPEKRYAPDKLVERAEKWGTAWGKRAGLTLGGIVTDAKAALEWFQEKHTAEPAEGEKKWTKREVEAATRKVRDAVAEIAATLAATIEDCNGVTG